MPITAKQAQKRKRYLGSSDAAAVLGLNPFRSAADVYHDKVGDIVATGLDHSNDAIEVGNAVENAVLNWFAKKQDLSLVKNQFRVHDNKVMASSFDALVKDDPTQAVEAKTTGITGRYVASEWGEVETDAVPEYIALQCFHQMAVLPDVRLIWIPVLMGGVGLRFYRIERNDELIKDLTEAELGFWHDNVLKRVPPEDSLPSLRTLKQLRREPEKVIELEEALVQRWLCDRDNARIYNKLKETTERELLTALGDAEAGECSLGRLTYFESQRKPYTVPATSFRRLYFKKAKEKKNG